MLKPKRFDNTKPKKVVKTWLPAEVLTKIVLQSDPNNRIFASSSDSTGYDIKNNYSLSIHDFY